MLSVQVLLGYMPVEITSSSNELIASISRAFPPVTSESIAPLNKVINLDEAKDANNNLVRNLADTNPTYAISYLIAWAARQYQGWLWLDAATLVTTYGDAILIAGLSYAGKTTLSLSMSLGYNWKILSEDITFIDLPNKQIALFRMPLSLRAGTCERIRQSLDIELLPTVGGDWFFAPQVFADKPAPLTFKGVFILGVLNPEQPEKMAQSLLSPDQCLRKLLPLSNAIRLSGGIANLSKAIAHAHCVQISGGELQERIATLENLFA